MIKQDLEKVNICSHNLEKYQMPETDQAGNKIKKADLQEVLTELSTWDVENVIALCATLIITHTPYWNELKYELKRELNEGEGDELSINC